MGKLNYSARRISGIKAAQVVSKDLKKRIPPNTGSKAASRDPHVEIDVAGKDLTDEGFAIFIDDLIKCMTYRDDEHTEGMARVTEFHLQNNGLTVQSLRKLGEVVALGAGDLRELDISHNNIRVETAEEKDIWFNFLNCFKNCYMLKKLDLGSNPLGAGGVEILARVYIKSDLDYLEDDAEAVIGNKTEEEKLVEEFDALKIANEKENETPAPTTKSGSRAKKSPGKARVASGHQNGTAHNGPKGFTPAELKHFACIRGLRSIPYLILSDIAMTSSCAVILTGMLTRQRTPEHLLDFLPGGKAVVLPDVVSECKSLIWKPNDGLTPHAKRLLEIAEVISDSKTEFLSEDDDEDHDSQDEDARDLMAQRKLQKKMDVEYTRLTKRVRMEALKQEGVQCMDIWHTALKMIFTSRALLLDDMDRATTSASEDSTSASEHEEDLTAHPPVEELEQQELPVIEGISPRASIHEAMLQQLPIREIVVREYPGPYEFTDTSSPAMGPFHPNADAFDEEFPALQGPPVEDAPPRGTERTVQDSEASPSSQSKDTAPKNGKGNARTSNGAKSSQKSQWRFGLSFALWRRIIADAVGADGILDVQQQEQIIRYASDWNSVSYEMSIVGAEDHQQIWKMLETVGCFTFSVL